MNNNSWLHRMPAVLKIITLFAFSILVFSISNFFVLLSFLIVAVGLALCAKLSKSIVMSLLKTIIPFVVFFMFYEAIFQTWQLGVMLSLRLSTVVLAASIISATTSSLDFISALEKILSPLQRFKIKTKNLTLGVWMALRFIPLIQQNLSEIKIAQQARGLRKNSMTLLIPLLIKTFKTADAVSEAIEIRGLGEE